MRELNKFSNIVFLILLWSLFGEKTGQTLLPNRQKYEIKLTAGITNSFFGIPKIPLFLEEQKKNTLFKKQAESSELPSPFEKMQIDNIIHRTYAEQIWEKQDKIMGGWPVYTAVRDKLREELTTELNFEKLTSSELIQIAIKLREKFWQKGGCLSKITYEDAYKARLLLEYVHENNPENLKVIDELAETIQSANKIAKHNKQRAGIYPNEEVRKMLLELRSKQFQQIRKEIRHNRKPTMADFKCGCDLEFLQQGQDKRAAKDTIEWLQDNAWLGSWTAYDKILAEHKEFLDNGIKTYLEIYFVPQDKFLDNCKYSRRLPSFQGPKKRGAFLLKEDIDGKMVTDHIFKTQ